MKLVQIVLDCVIICLYQPLLVKFKTIKINQQALLKGSFMIKLFYFLIVKQYVCIIQI